MKVLKILKILKKKNEKCWKFWKFWCASNTRSFPNFFLGLWQMTCARHFPQKIVPTNPRVIYPWHARAPNARSFPKFFLGLWQMTRARSMRGDTRSLPEAFLNWSFLATASSAPKQSILKVDLMQYRNILVQNHCLMKHRPLHCSRFVPLGHILRLLISELRSF